MFVVQTVMNFNTVFLQEFVSILCLIYCIARASVMVCLAVFKETTDLKNASLESAYSYLFCHMPFNCALCVNFNIGMVLEDN